MKKLSLYILSAALLTTSLSAVSKFSLDFNKDTRGLVRKMDVSKDPFWVSKVVIKDSKEFYFSSPKSMFEFYFNPEKWPSAKASIQEDIKQIVVTDYSTHRPINAKTAFYVYGSNKTSPAGDDLPAFKLYSEAKAFADKNNGKRVLSFKEVSKGLVELLNGDI